MDGVLRTGNGIWIGLRADMDALKSGQRHPLSVAV
jgi:metal-dependent amidase/aminoacylase/carboxypeptidase family protein